MFYKKGDIVYSFIFISVARLTYIITIFSLSSDRVVLVYIQSSMFFTPGQLVKEIWITSNYQQIKFIKCGNIIYPNSQNKAFLCVPVCVYAEHIPTVANYHKNHIIWLLATKLSVNWSVTDDIRMCHGRLCSQFKISQGVT